jgi:hypothetical protein
VAGRAAQISAHVGGPLEAIACDVPGLSRGGAGLALVLSAEPVMLGSHLGLMGGINMLILEIVLATVAVAIVVPWGCFELWGRSTERRARHLWKAEERRHLK